LSAALDGPRYGNRLGYCELAMGICVVAMTLSGQAEAQELFPRFDVHVDGQYVTSDDPRFNWIFHFGGEIDLVRAGNATATFVAGYEAIAGEQFRRFDVNQGNYLLEGQLLFGVWGAEIGPVWHHVSRHLSDRLKRFPIDWNMIAIRAKNDHVVGGVALAWQADVRATVTNAYVDYDWEAEAGGTIGYRLSPRLVWTGAGSWRLVGVDGSRDRGSQVAGRLESALRLEGRAVAAEVFIGVERRIDPYPIEFGTASWFLAGLRLSSR
jgi:hypothetical protein